MSDLTQTEMILSVSRCPRQPRQNILANKCSICLYFRTSKMGDTTLSITTLSITTLSIKTLSIKTLSITILSITILSITTFSTTINKL